MLSAKHEGDTTISSKIMANSMVENLVIILKK